MFGIDSIFGLPVHILVVHFAVVLVPLAAVAMIGTGWRPAWRRSYAAPIAMIAVAGALATIVAAGSGETLQHSLRQAAQAAGTRANFSDHPEQGDTARIFAVLFAGASVGLAAVDRWWEKLSLPAKLGTVAYVVASLLGVLAIITITIAGHSGATLVWNDLGNFVKPS